MCISSTQTAGSPAAAFLQVSPDWQPGTSGLPRDLGACPSPLPGTTRTPWLRRALHGPAGHGRLLLGRETAPGQPHRLLTATRRPAALPHPSVEHPPREAAPQPPQGAGQPLSRPPHPPPLRCQRSGDDRRGEGNSHRRAAEGTTSRADGAWQQPMPELLPPRREFRPCCKRIRPRSPSLPGPPLAAGPAPPRSPAAAASITAAGTGRGSGGGADRKPSGAARSERKKKKGGEEEEG